MQIAQAKEIDLVGFIEGLGFREVPKGRSDEAWFLSPLRGEDTPSFKVNRAANMWTDFGDARPGGDIIDFVIAYGPQLGWGTMTTSQALAKIEQLLGGSPTVGRRPREGNARSARRARSDRYRLRNLSPLRHEGLRAYLDSRAIDPEVAAGYIGEAWYEDRVSGRVGYALGWSNLRGGVETRDRLFKRVIGRKGISVFTPGNGTAGEVAVYEGAMDFLTHLTHTSLQPAGCVVVLNSASLVGAAAGYIEAKHPGAEVLGVLQNDEAGLEATRRLLGRFPGMRCANEAYAGYKDLNDYVRGIAMEPAEREASAAGIAGLRRG